MQTDILGEVMEVGVATAAIKRDSWDGVAAYVLWDRSAMTPIYCGTAATKSRLTSHFSKDDPTSRVSPHNIRNPELTHHWQSQAKGWLGISYHVFPTSEEAKQVERAIIAELGIRKSGNKLFNQRISG